MVAVASTALLRNNPARAAALHVYSQALGLTTGTRLGVSEVAARIGEGGMARRFRDRQQTETSGRHQDSHRVTLSAALEGTTSHESEQGTVGKG